MVCSLGSRWTPRASPWNLTALSFAGLPGRLPTSRRDRKSKSCGSSAADLSSGASLTSGAPRPLPTLRSNPSCRPSQEKSTGRKFTLLTHTPSRVQSKSHPMANPLKPRKLRTDSPAPEQTFSSSEVAGVAGVSLRQLQWWDERKVVSPRHEGHRRVYLASEVVE